MEDYVRNILALSLIRGIGAAFMKKNRRILLRYRNELDLLSSFGGKITPQTLQAQLPMADAILADCERAAIEVLTIADDWYPPLLLALKAPPPVLYYRGNIDLLTQVLTLLGTRRATPLGIKIAEKLAEHFGDAFAICNGLARGIEQSALQQVTPQGRAIGVLGGGLLIDRTLATQHRQQAQAIWEANGLLLSEFPPEKVADKFSVIKAQRIQAGLAAGLLLIQSPLESHTKYAIRSFVQLKRPLGFIDFSRHLEYQQHPAFAANRLLQKGLNGLQQWTQIKPILTTSLDPIQSVSDYEPWAAKAKALVQT